MTKAKVYRKLWTENALQDAINYIRAGHTTQYSKAAKKFQVPYYTLRNRYLALNDNARHAHEHQQLLCDVEEHVLCDWIEHRSDITRPLGKRTLLRKVEQITKKKPSQTWYRRFLRRHPEIWLGKPSGLDPK